MPLKCVWSSHSNWAETCSLWHELYPQPTRTLNFSNLLDWKPLKNFKESLELPSKIKAASMLTYTYNNNNQVLTPKFWNWLLILNRLIEVSPIVLILCFTSPISQFLRNIKVNLYILGFLANPVMKMEAKRRHETIQGLLNITFLETVEPITVNYSLLLSSEEIMNARSSQIILWDRKASKFFAQKLDWSSGCKNFKEYATCFSEAIYRGVLWENGNHIGALAELIKLAFMLEFNEEVVMFLMKSKNLQIIKEDNVFLSSAFPSD